VAGAPTPAAHFATTSIIDGVSSRAGDLFAAAAAGCTGMPAQDTT